MSERPIESATAVTGSAHRQLATVPRNLVFARRPITLTYRLAPTVATRHPVTVTAAAYQRAGVDVGPTTSIVSEHVLACFVVTRGHESAQHGPSALSPPPSLACLEVATASGVELT